MWSENLVRAWIRYYQNSIVDDWPTSCTMVTAVLMVGAMTLLLIVFFGSMFPPY